MADEQNDELYHRARKRAKDLRDFYTHVIVYLAVNLVLLLINLISSPDALWFYWPAIFWGIGLGFHGLSVMLQGNLLGQDWEDRKVEKFVQKYRKKED